MQQVARFVLVGVLNTAFSFSIYGLLVWLGLHYSIANLVATVAGIVFSFRTQGALVFGNRDWRLFRRFVPVWAVIYGVNVGLIALFISAGLNAYSAGAAALPPTVVMSFLLQKHLVFRLGGRVASIGSR